MISEAELRRQAARWQVNPMVAMDRLDMDRVLNRRAEFQADWERRLHYLVPVHQGVAFESAWQSTLEAIRLAQSALPK